MKYYFHDIKRIALGVLLLIGVSAKASTYYVRPFDSTAWSNLPGATIYTLAPGNAFAFTATYLATDTFYFAAGAYNIPSTSGITITKGKIYGGFSGNETEIDLNARATSDKDGNGMVEPWEFTNEVAITGNGQFAGVGTNGRNFVTVTGGEINGITLQNHYYYKTGTNYAGTITLGSFTENPLKANDIDANKGVMTLCTVKQIKSVALGPIMLTNMNSVIDKCLIEECVTTKAAGGSAIYMPLVGGQILNSVIRNNVATGSGGFGAIYATTDAINSDNGSGNMNAIVQNCVIYNNTAPYGAAIRAVAQAGKRGIQIINCTLANNKTTSVGNSSVDLQNGGTFVNSIVVDDLETELRPASANGFISNSAYGALYASTPSANVWPGIDMASGMSASDFNFFRNSTTSGAMISGVNGTNTFVQADYDALRQANYQITSGGSVAFTTPCLKILPTTYTVGGLGLTTITHTATIPTTDITGNTRTTSTLGAYDFTFIAKDFWTISASTNNAYGSVISGIGEHANNTSVTLTAAVSAVGKRFMNWTDGSAVVSTSSSYTFTANSDRSLVANFGDVYPVYYVCPSGSSKWNDIGAAADQIITTNNFKLQYKADNTGDSAATYYLAAGSYTVPADFSITTGKIMGGFSGDETEIDPDSRAIVDKDGNGIVEPWEFANETIFTPSSATSRFTGVGTETARFLTVSGTDGEVNGVTLTDFNCLTNAGPICLGLADNIPTAANNVSGKQGVLRLCTVKKIKSTIGIVMSTNKLSIIDRCLIESNVVNGSNSGGSLFLNSCGGKVSGCMVRNNAAVGSGGLAAGILATSLPDAAMDAIVENCLVYNNFSATNSGAIRGVGEANKCGLQIVNSTIVNNKTNISAVTNNGSVEFIGGGLIANSIILGDPSAELRANTVNNYISSNVFGEYATGSATLYGANNVSGKLTADLKFVNPTSFIGVMIPDYTTPYDAVKYNAIRQANFKIDPNNAYLSPAVTNNSSLSVLPSSYLIGGTGPNVSITASIPSADITGLERTGNHTLGAYQYGLPTTLVTIDNAGALTYTPDEVGGVIPDFSGVGYRNGEMPIPVVPVVLEITPVAGDNFNNVQNAINQVSAMPLQSNGFRGAILLKAGLYAINKEFKISASGIVLRGEGLTTELRATATTKSGFLRILGSSGKTENSSTRKKITDSYVPIGTKTITVETGHAFVVGDWVHVRREPNDAWIKLLGMDLLTLIHPTDLSVYNWSAGSYIINYERQILKVEGDVLTLDAPIVDPIDHTYANGYVTRFSSARIKNCGVEDMKMTSTYITTWDSSVSGVAHDENHAFTAVYFDNAEHCWARKINAYYFGNSCAYIESGAAFITVDSCAFYDPISPIVGGYRYPFNIDGHRCLVKNCISRNGRHDYVDGSRTPGPNVFYNCTSTLQHADSGPHHRWSTGILFDNITTNAALNVQDRADSGSGHGWAGSQIMFWNCVASRIVLQDPASTHCNWAIGCIGNITNKGDWTTRPSGIIQSKGFKIATIPSLYRAQLNERLKNLSTGTEVVYPKTGFKTTKTIYAVNEGIRIDDAKDTRVNVYSITGQLIKSIFLTSDNQTIPANKGFCIVKVGNQVVKVMVK
ncbi:MAG: DUF6383 domain-containing protein [Bacteroidia bacterium]|nr:DUF6383 domain-containing protein [Bacteroidia bacterium]